MTRALLNSCVTLPMYRDTMLLNCLEKEVEGEGGKEGIRKGRGERRGREGKGGEKEGRRKRGGKVGR